MKAGDEVWRYTRNRWRKAKLVRIIPNWTGGDDHAEIKYASDDFGRPIRVLLSDLHPQEKLLR